MLEIQNDFAERSLSQEQIVNTAPKYVELTFLCLFRSFCQAGVLIPFLELMCANITQSYSQSNPLAENITLYEAQFIRSVLECNLYRGQSSPLAIRDNCQTQVSRTTALQHLALLLWVPRLSSNYSRSNSCDWLSLLKMKVTWMNKCKVNFMRLHDIALFAKMIPPTALLHLCFSFQVEKLNNFALSVQPMLEGFFRGGQGHRLVQGIIEKMLKLNVCIHTDLIKNYGVFAFF